MREAMDIGNTVTRFLFSGFTTLYGISLILKMLYLVFWIADRVIMGHAVVAVFLHFFFDLIDINCR